MANWGLATNYCYLREFYCKPNITLTSPHLTGYVKSEENDRTGSVVLSRVQCCKFNSGTLSSADYTSQDLINRIEIVKWVVGQNDYDGQIGTMEQVYKSNVIANSSGTVLEKYFP